MKKKGFTLVELLAVIAILAILVIIALPNIMDLFNQAKKNSFENEVKEIYKTAQSQFITDSINSSTSRIYGKFRTDYNNSDDSCMNENFSALSLTGRNEIEYAIRFDESGNVTRFYVIDGTYRYRFDYQASLSQSSVGYLTIEEIAKGDEKNNFNNVISDAPVEEPEYISCDGDSDFMWDQD